MYNNQPFVGAFVFWVLLVLRVVGGVCKMPQAEQMEN
jgi:hypothetical protein